jgi:hypothetical protein
MIKLKKKFFNKISIFLVSVFTVFSLLSGVTPTPPENIAGKDSATTDAAADSFSTLYSRLNLDSLELSHEAFALAINGYRSLVASGAVVNRDILSIVDFSLPSSRKRLFVIDLSGDSLLFNTYVSHGRNSGMEQATRFSNNVNSFQSSLGFFVTGSTYKGEHGYSLRLLGLEKGINDNALARGIVIHAAKYVNEQLARQRGYIGRSLGCPAIPVALHKPIIQKIKDGSCLFLYGSDVNYTAKSSLMNASRV